MKCLFVIWDVPLSYMYSGTSCRAMMDFEALTKNNVEVHVLRFVNISSEKSIEKYEFQYAQENLQVRFFVKTWNDVLFSFKKNKKSVLQKVAHYLQSSVEFAFPGSTENSIRLDEYIDRLKPEVVWTVGGQANAIGLLSKKRDCEWVVVHTDWHFRLFGIRSGNAKLNLKSWLLMKWLAWRTKRTEESFVKSSSIAITASAVQATDMKRLGAKRVYQIPQVFPSKKSDLPLAHYSFETNRVFHVGGLVTTSNYIGLMSYLSKVHFNLSKIVSKLELHIIGSADGAKENLMHKLKEAQAKMYGFQYDLSEILKPYDLQIIPYEFNTGIRSKMPLLFSLHQVVICTKASVDGMPEIVNEKNCVVCENLEDFEEAIKALCADVSYRKRIGDGARKTFEDDFTLPKVLSVYGNILKELK